VSTVLIVGLRLENPGWTVPDTDGYRNMNWAYSKARWERLLPDVPIFEGHDEGSHTFCLARAQNEAARLAGDWGIAVYVGADFIAESEEMVRAGIQRARETGQFTITHSQTTMLHEEGAERVRGGEEPDPSMGDTYGNPFTGITIIPRKLYDEVGGFDERFVGWGWEDQAFWSACWAFGRGYQRVDGHAYHLWHPRTRSDNEESPLHSESEVLGRRYLAARSHKEAMKMILEERDAWASQP
jgi:hypothetical protein